MTRDGWALPKETNSRACGMLLHFLFRGRGISEQIFVTKGNLGRLQESQIIKRYDLSLLMFPRHSQRVSKCFSAAWEGLLAR